MRWRAEDLDYLELEDRSLDAEIAGKYELIRREIQTNQEKLESEQL